MMKRLIFYAALTAAASTPVVAEDAGVRDLCAYQSRAQGVPYRECVADNTAAETATAIMRERFPDMSDKIDACIDRFTAGVAVNWRDVGACIRG